MFLPLEVFKGIKPYHTPPKKLPNGKKTQGVVHFGALSFGTDGMPMTWFTTNYWVTYEFMMPADAIASRLKLFNMKDARVDPLVNDWLTAAVRVFQDPIIDMLKERDQLLEEKKAELGEAVFADKSIEIMSHRAFDL